MTDTHDTQNNDPKLTSEPTVGKSRLKSGLKPVLTQTYPIKVNKSHYIILT